jgi:hypothetical protein
MSIKSVISSRYESYTLEGMDSGSFVGGIWTETKNSRSVNFHIQPLNNAELEQFPEGTASLGDIKLYNEDGASVPDKSVITWKGDKYEIRSHKDWTDYKMYVGKKLIK